MIYVSTTNIVTRIYLLFWDFLLKNWEILHIFSIGKGAHNGPQNQPRKIPVSIGKGAHNGPQNQPRKIPVSIGKGAHNGPQNQLQENPCSVVSNESGSTRPDTNPAHESTRPGHLGLFFFPITGGIFYKNMMILDMNKDF